MFMFTKDHNENMTTLTTPVQSNTKKKQTEDSWSSETGSLDDGREQRISGQL